MGWFSDFQGYLQHSAKFWVEEEAWRFAFLTDRERKAVKRKKQNMKERGAKIVKTTVDGQIFNSFKFENQLTADYALHACHLIKQKNDFYLEEEIEYRRATFIEEKLMKDERWHTERGMESAPNVQRERVDESRSFFQYRRLAAVRYADRWWDSYNPAYKSFDVDCTNYISQCLRAGGAPMNGQSNRAKGWWYSGKNWSYSWAVAHSFRWYLSGASTGLRAKELSSSDQLIPGDVICYDFEGDGVYDHSTIVTAKDYKGQPLVNAHTVNCRKHYWDYEDSVAWTPDIRYKFFRIAGND